MSAAARPDPLVASFDRAAARYGEHAQVQRALAAWLAEWLPAGRQGAVLEMGAGPGVFTRQLLPWHGPVVAADLSPAMTLAGRNHCPEATWITRPAEAPPAGPWDLVVSSSMLQWVDDPVAVFRAWRAELAPHGQVLAGLFAAGSLPEWSALAGAAAPLRWRTIADWRAALAAAGLRIERDDTAGRTVRYPSARAFLRSLHGVGAAPMRRLGAGQLRRLLTEYETRHGGPGGVSAFWTFYRFQASSSGCP